jgi:hypothetical protein
MDPKIESCELAIPMQYYDRKFTREYQSRDIEERELMRAIEMKERNETEG